MNGVSRRQVRGVQASVFLALVAMAVASGAVQPPGLVMYAQALPPPAHLLERLKATGTTLDPDAEAGVSTLHGTKSKNIQALRPFAALRSTPVDPPPSLPVSLSRPSGKAPRRVSELSIAQKKEFLSHVDLAYPDGVPPDTKFALAFYESSGLPTADPPITATRAEYDSARTSVLRAEPNPKGGMVNLRGGEIHFVDGLSTLSTGALDVCESKLCLKFPVGQGPGGVSAISVPIQVDDIFAEVWQRVYVENIDAFYLSINPTPATLRGQLGSPGDRLRVDDPKLQGYRVVTAGDIETANIGHILFDADVLFKSAGLGFDVMKGPGHAVPGLGVTNLNDYHLRIAMKSASPDDIPSSGDSWCRFYWSSAPQAADVDIRTAQLKLTGSPVVAKAEPMIAKDNDLAPYPRGTWCQGAQIIAKQLTALSAGPEATMPTSIRSLVEVARAQNFVRWVRDTELSVSGGFKDRLPQVASAAPIPTSTSGIRGSSGTYVRVNKMNRLTPVVQVYTPTTSYDHAARALSGIQLDGNTWFHEQLASHGIKKDANGTWMCPDLTLCVDMKSKQADYEASLLAQATGGTLRNDVLPYQFDDTDQEQKKLSVGVEHSIYALPVNVHGGALLEATKWKGDGGEGNEEAIIGPDGRPIFARRGQTLHFWSTDDSSTAFTSLEHIAVTGAVVVERAAAEGVLRFFLKMQPGANRVVGTDDVRFGPSWQAEWHRAVPLQPEAAPRTATSREEEDGVFVRMADGCNPCGEADLQFLRPGKTFPVRSPEAWAMRRITVRTYPEGGWIVEVRTKGADATLDALWPDIERAKDVAKGFRNVLALAQFGYKVSAETRMKNVRDWVEEGQGSTESIDRVLFAAMPDADLDLGDTGDERLMTALLMIGDLPGALFVASLDSPRVSDQQVAKLRSHLHKLAGMIPRGTMKVLHGDIADFEEDLEDRALTSAKMTLIRDAQAHRSAAMLTQALTDGLSTAPL